MNESSVISNIHGVDQLPLLQHVNEKQIFSKDPILKYVYEEIEFQFDNFLKIYEKQKKNKN